MSDETNKKEQKENQEPGAVQGIVRTYRAEYKKIVWPSWPTIIKHTVTVIVVSLIFGAYIALTDGVFSTLFNRFVGLVG